MTKREKIMVLKAAKKYISRLSYKRIGGGLCVAMRVSLSRWEFEWSDFGIVERPTDIDGYWFPFSKRGDAARIRILNAAIKRLQKPNKKK